MGLSKVWNPTKLTGLLIGKKMTTHKILLVDDESENLRLLQTLLKDDYTLAIAKDGKKALALAAESPDLILLDIVMPGMDGYEVCKRLKADEQTKDIPIIFVTSMREADNEVEGFNLGAADYITKPISPPIVKARVKMHLALKTAYQEVKRQNIALIAADALKRDVERITRHDLKSPINGVVGFADLLLRDGSLSEGQKKQVEIILDCGRSALHKIHLSLGLLQMEQGSYALEPHSLDLMPIIRTIQTELSSLFRIKKLTLRIRIQEQEATETGSFFVWGEETLCQTMLKNLLKNALEASPPDKTITLSLKDSGTMGFVSLHNFGAVPEKIRGQFFEKYVTANKKSGSGLGAYFAQLIAETQGGKMSMKTDDTKGTKIILSIPKGKGAVVD